MSQGVTIDTPSFPAFKLYDANVTDATVTEPTPTLTAPNENGGKGVIACGHGGGTSSSGMKFVFFGVGADATTFLAYIYGWEVVASRSGKQPLFVPVLLATLTAITLDSNQPGVDGTEVPGTTTVDYFATAITQGVGNSGISLEVVSPGHASHEIAHVVVDTKGCRWLEVRFATGSSATSCNGIARKM